MLGDRTCTCDRCGDEYDSYVVLVEDDFSEIVEHLSEDWDGLCKPCRMAVTDGGAYLTESEREELEPKENVGADESGDS